jgi:hypothetical protein
VCGGETAAWISVCPHCRSFDSIEWRRPGRAPASRLEAIAEMTPPLPVPGSAAARASETTPRLGLAIDDA